VRPLVARHLRDSPQPSFPPGPRESYALGGTVFDVVEAAAGVDACIALASSLDPAGGRAALSAATGQDAARLERAWRARLDELRS